MFLEHLGYVDRIETYFNFECGLCQDYSTILSAKGIRNIYFVCLCIKK